MSNFNPTEIEPQDTLRELINDETAWDRVDQGCLLAFSFRKLAVVQHRDGNPLIYRVTNAGLRLACAPMRITEAP